MAHHSPLWYNREMEMLYALLGAFAVMLASLVGIIVITPTIARMSHRVLHFVPSFAAGVFLVIVLGLLYESSGEMTHTWVLLWFLGGFLIFTLLSWLAPEPEPDGEHESKMFKNPSGLARAKRLLLADGTHNIADGIVLVPAFVTDVRLGLAVLLGILVHELVQELTEYFVLIEAGYTRLKALAYNFLVSGTILIGVIIGFFFNTFGNALEPAILALAAGGFFFVVSRDLLPHSLRHGRKDLTVHVILFVSGILLMTVVGLLPVAAH